MSPGPQASRATRGEREAAPDTRAEQLLPFTAHRMDLGDGVLTIADGGGEDPVHALSTAALALALGGFSGKRVLDLGSLEGGYTIAFARLGASEAIGVEARTLNLRRANWARDRLGVDKASFRRGDVTALASMALGAFDGVFASGILYHLADPFTFVEELFATTGDVALFDTNVALPAVNNHDTGPLVTRHHRGHPYEGRVFTEFTEPPDMAVMEGGVWSAWGNNESFWLTERSLVDLLRAVGFAYLHKVIVPGGYQCGPGCPPECRVLYVAKKRFPAAPLQAVTARGNFKGISSRADRLWRRLRRFRQATRLDGGAQCAACVVSRRSSTRQALEATVAAPDHPRCPWPT